MSLAKRRHGGMLWEEGGKKQGFQKGLKGQGTDELLHSATGWGKKWRKWRVQETAMVQRLRGQKNPQKRTTITKSQGFLKKKTGAITVEGSSLS